MDSFNVLLSILVFALGSSGILWAILLYNPEKIEKWSSLLWKLLSFFDSVFRNAHRMYVKHDLQSRVNDFVRRLRKTSPQLAATKVRLEWADPNQTIKGFLENGQVCLRIRKEDRGDLNFVHGTYLFVSTSLLHKTKRYISSSQRESLDLYVCSRIFESEKPAVVDAFLEEYLHKRLGKGTKANAYFDRYASIDEAGYFYSVLLQELHFLGQRVFGARQDSTIITEIDKLINFLVRISERSVGDDTDLEFYSQYCNFAIMIIGKAPKIEESIEPYAKFIQKLLKNSSLETLYIRGPVEREAEIDEICTRFNDELEPVFEYKSKTRVALRSGRSDLRDTKAVVLRRRNIKLFKKST
jgi:hypothetical protein